MVCLSCATPVSGRLCHDCARTLRTASDRVLPEGIRLVAAFEHHGSARVLMHHLKYRGVTAIAERAADLVCERLPRLPLVPVPRALSRRLKYGVDPARIIADAIARRLQVPVINALAPHVHTPRRAGRDHSRAVSSFRVRGHVPFQVLVVDDVVTTGATLVAAVDALGADTVRSVVAANVVPHLSNVPVA